MSKSIRPFPPLSTEDIERFWEKVDRRGADECWPWKGLKNRAGYGRINFSGKDYIAHRTAYFLHYKKDPIPLLVCHHCDNPPCCNPAHCFKGRHVDNSADMVRKGRNAHVLKLRHEAHPQTKLTIKKVRKIRRLYALKRFNQYELASNFNVSRSTIADLLKFRSWRDI